IRVLKLEPSDQHDSIITCSLEVVPFKSATPQYEALSYVWGDQTERNEIILDSQPTSITRNLWTTLKYIRQPDTSRTLWIDAVCINQADIHERNEQVKQMGDIYSRASRVLIWLG
ncbi:HET-domain-containing protein, partial [Thozetella sp. PMI_491]